MTMIVYSRADGPLCYEVSLFGTPESSHEVPLQLLASGLCWYWVSERINPISDAHETVQLPRLRPLTLLAPDTLALSFTIYESGTRMAAVGLSPWLGSSPAAVNRLSL
jgi:hypothetical protein